MTPNLASSPHRYRPAIAFFSLLLVLGMMLAACGSGGSTTKQAIAGIEDIMVSQLPVLPLTVNVYWDEYTTKNWTGWPDASNPYDSGAPYNMPDAANVILHLTPAS